MAPAGLCAGPLQLREFQTQRCKTSKSWREARWEGKRKQLHSAAPRSLSPVQPVYHFNTHQHISFINHKSLQVINATKLGALENEPGVTCGVRNGLSLEGAAGC